LGDFQNRNQSPKPFLQISSFLLMSKCMEYFSKEI
jgi:hypothetical protein